MRIPVLILAHAALVSPAPSIPMICVARPKLAFCERLRARMDYDTGEEPRMFPRETPVQTTPRPTRPPRPSRANTAAEYCSKWSEHFEHFCTDLERAAGEDTRLFCSTFANKCRRSPPTLPQSNSRPPPITSVRHLLPGLSECLGFEETELTMLEEGPRSAKIAELCEKYGVLGRTFCLSGQAVPAQYEARCQQFRDNCVDRREAPRAPVSSRRQAQIQRRVDEASVLQSVKSQCAKYQGIGERFCLGGVPLPTKYEQYCLQYRKYCAQPLNEPDDLRRIADLYSGNVGVGTGTNLAGIPFYPFNPAGAIGVGRKTDVDFGTWGGGYRQNTGVSDFWNSGQETGVNWYNGYYGTKNKWGIPLFSPINGESETAVKVPINGETLGDPISWGTRDGDSTGVDWLGGGVSNQKGWSLPFIGLSANTGTSVNFPSVGNILGGIPIAPDRATIDQIIAEDAARNGR